MVSTVAIENNSGYKQTLLKTARAGQESGSCISRVTKFICFIVHRGSHKSYCSHRQPSHLTPNYYLLPDESGINKIRAKTSNKGVIFFSFCITMVAFSKAAVYLEGCRDSMQSTKKQELSLLEAQEEKKRYLDSDLVIG